MVFPVVRYGGESWTIKKAQHPVRGHMDLPEGTGRGRAGRWLGRVPGGAAATRPGEVAAGAMHTVPRRSQEKGR